VLFVCAQCGGAIAGSALVYGIYGAEDQFEAAGVSNFGMEFILTFVVVFTYVSATSKHQRHRAVAGLEPGVTVGLAYMACLICYRGALNPARALGPAFVVNKFSYHW
jgi:glycerol uptake facilitator-like aquaporin